MYIAHIQIHSTQAQSVAKHSKNTGKLAKKLCSLKDLKMAAFLTGLLHDAGKNTDEFNEYILRAKADPSSVSRGEVIHSASGGCLISELAEKMNTQEYFAVELIREAIISHHGLYDCITPDGTVCYEKRAAKESQLDSIRQEVYSYVPKQELEKFFRQAVSELSTLVDRILTFINGKKGKLGSRHFYFGMSARLLLSLLIDSDRTDTVCFMDGRPLPKVASCQERKELWKKLSERLEDSLSQFDEVTAIGQIRKEIAEACFIASKRPSDIYHLVVPTGAGKTLSSLRYALNHAKRYGKKHIIYIAPYNSILEQNAEVIRKVLREDDLILEHHCNIVLEDEGENAEYKELTSNWATPIIVTTAVQFLETLFSSKTSSIRRMHALDDSVIILDEVQAIPIKCVSLFNLAMNYLAKIAGSSVVLCSATQPLFECLKVNSLNKPVDMMQGFSFNFHAFKRTEILDKTQMLPAGFDKNSLADFTLDTLGENRNVLLIVNTKSCARNVYYRLKELNESRDKDTQITLFHLSTNMCAANRKDTLDLIKKCLKGKKRMICVSTQLIEAGVDISFETVIRSLAGLDSIIQAAGRCNRNREKETEPGKVFIVKIADEDVSKLTDIKKAQEAMESVFAAYRSQPGFSDDYLQSKEAMDRYYANYFKAREAEMDYRIPQMDTSLVQLLSDNPIGTNSLNRKNGGQKTQLILRQAFKTAGDYFEVIPEKGMIDVVVEYNDESRELIAQMNSDISMECQKGLLRRLQPYSVSISEQQRNRLSDALFSLKNGSVVALRKEYYSEETGVCETPSRMDLHLF